MYLYTLLVGISFTHIVLLWENTYRYIDFFITPNLQWIRN